MVPCDLTSHTNSLPGDKANSAFHPSGVGKWGPASAGKEKASMVHSDERGCATKTEIPWERLRGVITTKCYTNPSLPLLEARLSSGLYAGIKRGTVSPHITAWNQSNCLLCMYVLCCLVVSENRFWHILCVPQWAARCKSRRRRSCHTFHVFVSHFSDKMICNFHGFVSTAYIWVFWCFLFALLKFLFADLLTHLRGCTICTCFALILL